MNTQETWILLQIAKEAAHFPQLRAIKEEALKQLATIADDLGMKPDVSPRSEPALVKRKVV